LPEHSVPFKRDDDPSGPWRDKLGNEWPAHHAWRWDARAARVEGRWSVNADQLACAWIEHAEDLLKQGKTARVWDTLADLNLLPPELPSTDRYRIIRQTLRRDAELGRIDSTAVTVLLRDLPNTDNDRSRLENQNPEMQRLIRAEILADPSLSVRGLARKYNVTRDTVARIRKELADPEE
jgi:hypothetical protein